MNYKFLKDSLEVLQLIVEKQLNIEEIRPDVDYAYYFNQHDEKTDNRYLTHSEYELICRVKQTIVGLKLEDINEDLKDIETKIDIIQENNVVSNEDLKLLLLGDFSKEEIEWINLFKKYKLDYLSETHKKSKAQLSQKRKYLRRKQEKLAKGGK